MSRPKALLGFAGQRRATMRIGKHADLVDWTRRVHMRAGEKPSGAWRSRLFLTGAGVGGALMYLLGSERRRRRLLVDRAVATARRGSRQVARARRIAVARAEGHAKGFIHRMRPPATEPLDDATLAHKVESVVFRSPKFPKGQISINAEEGKVFLRGQIDQAELIHDLEEAVRKVPGVRDVDNLLHLPGTPAPASQPRRDVHAR